MNKEQKIDIIALLGAGASEVTAISWLFSKAKIVEGESDLYRGIAYALIVLFVLCVIYIQVRFLVGYVRQKRLICSCSAFPGNRSCKEIQQWLISDGALPGAAGVKTKPAQPNSITVHVADNLTDTDYYNVIAQFVEHSGHDLRMTLRKNPYDQLGIHGFEDTLELLGGMKSTPKEKVIIITDAFRDRFYNDLQDDRDNGYPILAKYIALHLKNDVSIYWYDEVNPSAVGEYIIAGEQFGLIWVDNVPLMGKSQFQLKFDITLESSDWKYHLRRNRKDTRQFFKDYEPNKLFEALRRQTNASLMLA